MGSFRISVDVRLCITDGNMRKQFLAIVRLASDERSGDRRGCIHEDWETIIYLVACRCAMSMQRRSVLPCLRGQTWDNDRVQDLYDRGKH